MTVHLLDANVLIALTVVEHEHHDRASSWLGAGRDFAVCPVVEGSLVRFLLRMGESAALATALLRGVHAHPRCRFWSAQVSYAETDLSGVTGHRQVTDAYLAGLAAANGGLLATFDVALATLRPASTVLLP